MTEFILLVLVLTLLTLWFIKSRIRSTTTCELIVRWADCTYSIVEFKIDRPSAFNSVLKAAECVEFVHKMSSCTPHPHSIQYRDGIPYLSINRGATTRSTVVELKIGSHFAKIEFYGREQVYCSYLDVHKVKCKVSSVNEHEFW